jgi:hypothetical protein
MLRAFQGVGHHHRHRLAGVVDQLVLHREERLPRAACPNREGNKGGCAAILGRVWWVSTASTPAARSASVVSIALTRPLEISAPTRTA